MTEHLATSERQHPLCPLCEREPLYPPAEMCGKCERYIRDCEAEVSER